MTDLDIMKEMLGRAKIEYDQEVCQFKNNDYGTISLLVEAGYIGFVSCITFDSDGALERIEAGEY